MERPLPPPLDALPEEAARAFLARGEKVVAEEGEVLLEAQGPPATHLYLVLEGEVALEEEGEEVERLGPGSFFGYPSLLSGASPVFTVRARGKTRLLRFPKEAFEALLAYPEAQSPLALLRRVERLELARYGEEVARLVAGLFQAGVPALEIGRVVAGLNDALIRRLLQEAERTLGPPPVPYAFLVFGSEGRTDQALLTEQDNALALAEEGHEAYFQALAERVVEGLVAAGIPPCPGGYMATRWRLSLARWQEVFARWMEAPEPQALLDAQIFFDLRPVGGSLSLAALERLIQEKAKAGVFLYHLAQAALAFRPPLGLFGRVRTEEGFIDLKRHALAPIVSLARVYALMAGSPARRTPERLKQGAEKGAVSLELAERLEEAYAFFFHLRLKAQLQALKEGRPPGNRVVYKALSPLERRRALEGFRAILEAQEALALRFQIRL